MGFKSLFPFFNRDEVTPSERDDNPDVQSLIGRTLARLQGFSNALGVFKFIRSDYNGRLHITKAPTDFDNYRFGSVALIVGTVVIAPPNPDRQELWLQNVGGASPTMAIVIGTDVIWQQVLASGDIIVLTGITGQVQFVSAAAAGVINFVEF